MSNLNSQTAYWDTAATTNTSTHPVHTPWLDDVNRRAEEYVPLLVLWAEATAPRCNWGKAA